MHARIHRYICIIVCITQLTPLTSMDTLQYWWMRVWHNPADIAVSAAAQNDISVLAEYRKYIPTCDSYARTPLHAAVHCGHHKATQYILQNGGNPNAQLGDTQATPLILAAAVGHHSIVHTLLHYGALAHIQKRDGETAGDVARRNGHQRIVYLLQTFAFLGDPN